MMKRFITIAILVVFLLLVLLGCGAQSGKDYAYDDSAAMEAYDGGERGLSSAEYQEEIAMSEEKNSRQADGRYYIKNGDITVDVEDIRESERKINEYLNKKGGFIESSQFYSHSRERMTSYLTIRVPENSFLSTMAFLEEELGKMTSRSTGGQDVTMQYVDMEARINNLVKQEIRYTEILEDAETVEDILQIERELVRIRGDIESLTAQFNHLKERVDFATIHISLQQTVLATPGVTAVGFEGAWSRALNALTESVNMLINSAAGFFVFTFRALPYALLILAALFVAYRILKRWDKKKEEQKEHE